MKATLRNDILRAKRISFNPDRNYLNRATEEFIKQGGTIKQLRPEHSNYLIFIDGESDMEDADDFLLGL